MRCQIANIYVQTTQPPKLTVTLDATHVDSKPVFLTSLTGRLIANGHVIIEHLVVDSQSLRGVEALFRQKDERRSFNLYGAVSLRGVEAVERTRGTEDVRITSDFTSVMLEAIEGRPKPNEHTFLAGQPFWNQVWAQDRVYSRSDWLKLLSALGFGEVEIFELPRASLADDPPFLAAIEHLRDAETAFRQHQFDTTLFKCRKAVEAMGKHAANGNLKKGFELALGEAFGDDQVRIGVFDGMLKALSELDHTLGRHEQYPPVKVTRQEAEFALSAHVRLFGLLTTTIAERRKRREA